MLADFFSILLGESAHTITLALGGSGERTRFYSRSADQEVGPKADSRKCGNAEHHLLMSAHSRLCLADRQGTHDRHCGLLFELGETIRRRGSLVNDCPGGVALLDDCLFRFIEMLLEIRHEGCAARSHGRGVARVGLVLAVNVAVGVADVDLAKLGKEIDAGAIGSPEIGSTGFPISNIAGEQRTAKIVSGPL